MKWRQSPKSIFESKKMANEDVRLLFTVRSATSLKRRSLFFTFSPNTSEALLVKSLHFISLVKTFRLRSTCLSRRNLQRRWRRMKFSRFLLRQGCGGQAASKDGVVFLYSASLTRRLLQNCFPVSAATVLINISLKTIHAGGFRCAPEERGITAYGLAHRLWIYPRFCALQERGSRQTFPPSPARLQRANGMVSLFDLWASP